MVAYKLTLPEKNSIFLIFHISLLKPFVGEIEKCVKVSLPEQAIDAHPISTPHSIIGYRIVTIKGRKIEQVLVDWGDRS